MIGISRWLRILAKRSHRKRPATRTEPRRSPFPVRNKRLVKRRRALSLPGLREEAMTAAKMAGNGQSGLTRWRYGSTPTDTKAIPGPTRRRSPPGPGCPREGRLHSGAGRAPTRRARIRCHNASSGTGLAPAAFTDHAHRGCAARHDDKDDPSEFTRAGRPRGFSALERSSTMWVHHVTSHFGLLWRLQGF